MSANATADPAAHLKVSDADRRALDLLPDWPFYWLPAYVDAECSLCGRAAVFVTTADGHPRAWCRKHARDF